LAGEALPALPRKGGSDPPHLLTRKTITPAYYTAWQALAAARARLAAQRNFERRYAEAAAARWQWDERQQRLRDGIPKDLWARAKDAWGSELLPWEVGAFGQLVSIRPCGAFLKLETGLAMSAVGKDSVLLPWEVDAFGQLVSRWGRSASGARSDYCILHAMPPALLLLWCFTTACAALSSLQRGTETTHGTTLCQRLALIHCVWLLQHLQQASHVPSCSSLHWETHQQA